MSDQNSNQFIYDGACVGSLAEQSDLRVGDKILSLNGITLMDVGDLDIGIEKDPYKRVMEVLRGNQILTIEIYIDQTLKININKHVGGCN
jgi:S1-C subfamily serine protease